MKSPFTIAPLFAVLAAVSVYDRHVMAAPIFNPANNHYYEVINQSIDWQNARVAAQALSFQGVSGDLAVITSAEENQFLTQAFGSAGLHFRWIGGLQTPGSTEPAGGWSWANGEAFTFNNWAPGEPNNFSGNQSNEDRIGFDHGVGVNGKQWNDLRGSSLLNGYVVESPTALTASVPEPGSLYLAS